MRATHVDKPPPRKHTGLSLPHIMRSTPKQSTVCSKYGFISAIVQLLRLPYAIIPDIFAKTLGRFATSRIAVAQFSKPEPAISGTPQ